MLAPIYYNKVKPRFQIIICFEMAGSTCTRASYAAGVMLYLMLTGTYPFEDFDHPGWGAVESTQLTHSLKARGLNPCLRRSSKKVYFLDAKLQMRYLGEHHRDAAPRPRG
jgi:hypothetical protein